MHRDDAPIAARAGRANRVEITESGVDLRRSARALQALTRVTVAEDIRQAALDLGRVASGEAFTVIEVGKTRLLPWELRQTVVAVVLQVPSQEERMVIAQVVIELGNVGVV